MIAAGLFQLDLIVVKKRRSEGKLQKVLQGFVGSRAMESRLIIGLLTPLLPCGLLYAMAAQAAASLSPAVGALTMGAFALGAVPALVVTGLATSFFTARLRRIGSLVAIVIMIVMGVVTIARGFGLSTSLLPHPTSIIEHLCGL
jgi:sulfite exporter TauE/SafE